MQQEDAAGPSAEDGLEQHGVDRNLLISLLGGKRRLPPTLHISEPETVTYTVAHEVQVTARNYKAAFASSTASIDLLISLLYTPSTRVGRGVCYTRLPREWAAGAVRSFVLICKSASTARAPLDRWRRACASLSPGYWRS